MVLQNGNENLWSVPIAGGEPIKLTSAGDVHPNFYLSPDSEHVVYAETTRDLYSSRLDGTGANKLAEDVNFLAFSSIFG